LSNLLHQTVEKLQKNHVVLRGPQLGKQRWRARLGILRVKDIRSFRNPPHTHIQCWSTAHLVSWYYCYQTEISTKLCSSNYTEAEYSLLQLKILFTPYILVKAKISRQIYILCTLPETKVTMVTVNEVGFLYYQ